MAATDNLAVLLNAFKENLAEYRVTGNTANKTAYEGAQRGIEAVLAARQANIGSNQTYIQDFLNKYENANGTLVALHEKAQTIQKVGPKIQDEYEQAKRMNAVTATAADNTTLYVKAAVVIGLLITIGVVGL